MRIVVYSALIGDQLRDVVAPPPAGCDARYVLFTNGPVVAGWERVAVSATLDKSPRMTARLLKSRPELWFPDAHVTIWIDANGRLLRPALHLAQAAGDASVAAFQHHRRTCLNDEARAIERRDARHVDAVARQMTEYRSAGFDPAALRPVTVTGLLIRANTEAVRTFNEVWEAQLLRHTLRDQLSVDYAAFATGTTIRYLPKTYVNNLFVKFTDHVCPPTTSH